MKRKSVKRAVKRASRKPVKVQARKAVPAAGVQAALGLPARELIAADKKTAQGLIASRLKAADAMKAAPSKGQFVRTAVQP